MISKGRRPDQPTHPGMTDHLWTLIQRCWSEDPWGRPPMGEVIKQLSPFSLPEAPTNFFGRDVIIKDLLGFAERSESITLLGAGGVGKTAITLTLLHHLRTLARFGRHRHFMRCHDLESSLDGFLSRLFEAIGAPHLEDTAQLQSHLSFSPPRILVLDGVESILDPLAPGAAEITSAIEELGRCENLCLLVTSKMDARITDSRRIEVPTLSSTGAQDVFYSRCRLRRSVEVDDIIEELDCHPLSLDLLASTAQENHWDEGMLLEAWDGQKTNILKAYGRQSLEDNIMSALATPTIQARRMIVFETLRALAALPGGVEESKLENTFAEISGIGNTIDALCEFSLVYRRDGFFKMLSPFRLYFLASGRALVSDSGSDAAHDTVSENIQYTPQDIFGFGLLFSFCQLCFSRMTNA